MNDALPATMLLDLRDAIATFPAWGTFWVVALTITVCSLAYCVCRYLTDVAAHPCDPPVLSHVPRAEAQARTTRVHAIVSPPAAARGPYRRRGDAA